MKKTLNGVVGKFYVRLRVSPFIVLGYDWPVETEANKKMSKNWSKANQKHCLKFIGSDKTEGALGLSRVTK